MHSPSSEAVTVLCMKWGTRYGADDVNRLYGGVRKHLHRPFRLVCMTDDRSGLEAGIESRELPSVCAPESDSRWKKLAVFDPELRYDSEQVLFLDLDLVVVGPLDDLFAVPGDVVVIKNRELQPRPLKNLRRRLVKPSRFRYVDMVGNTSCYLFRPGTCADLHGDYTRNMDQRLREYPIEQEYLSAYLSRRGRLGYFPRGWCVSFQENCLSGSRRFGSRHLRMPADSRIALFEGEPKPDGLLRSPRLGDDAKAWLRQNWEGDSPGGLQ